MNRFFFRKVFLAFMAGVLITLFASGASAVSAASKFSQEELAYMPAVQLIELFQKGETTPSEVLEAQINRVKKYNGEYNVSRRDLVNELDTFNAGKVNAITFDNFAEARKLAKEADERYRNGSARRLEGITIGIKDENEVEGWRVDAGSLLLKDCEPSAADGAMIQKLMQDVIAGPSPEIHATIRPKLDYPQEYASIQGQKVAVAYCRNWLQGGLSQESDHAMDATVAALKEAGAQVEQIELDVSAENFMPTYFKGLMSTSMYAIFNGLDEHRDQFSSYVKNLEAYAGKLTPQDQVDAEKMLGKLHRDVQQKVFEKGCIALVMPTLATPYFPADLEATPDKAAQVRGKTYSSTNLMLTPIWNLASRYPVVDMPVELSDKNVPVGVQIVSNTYDDLNAFRVAYALSKVIAPLYKDGRFPDFRNEK